ncbi:uncharacterized protein LOC133736053 isoform X1 [Rosa rugosa]|uniref:uncharacterized protein LOC133736053 isoform X1 n=1 Tax=Rosa rugosa TaxID=74645 RepID=UPI002B40EB7F|nr:uncharacterized protein LOC133736053 isoform X1 [Rosa rugosa]
MGMVIPLDGPIHGVPLGDGNVRVSVEVPIKGEALLPIPIGDEIVTLRQAIGTHVAWPRNLVIVTNEKPKLKTPNASFKPMLPQNLYKMPLSVRFLLQFARTMREEKPLKVAIDSGVFGYEQETYLNKDDIIEFCSMEPLSTVCMTIYMRHLWSSLKKDHKDNLYGFADPSSFSHDSGKRDERSFALSVRLEKSKEQQLIFAPYNFGFHWVMVVINPYSDMVYYLDSLNPVDIDHGLKGVIDVALRMFNAQKGRNRKNAIWKIIQCPTQAGKVECGYYVMRFMKAIIEDPTILTRSKFNNQSYNQEEIDDVRVEWADLVETLLQDDVE